MKIILTLSLLNICLFGFSQNWVEIQQRGAQESCIKVAKAKYFTFNRSSLLQTLPSQSQHSLVKIPLPNGKIASFEIKESEVLPQELISKYGLHAYKGHNISNVNQKIRLEYNNENGFHAMITGAGKTIFIDPVQQNVTGKVTVYYREDFVTTNKPKIKCGQHPSLHKVKAEFSYLRAARNLANETVVKTNYRIAVAATKEYTNFHGGTIQKSLSAITTTINRVSAIYEQEAAITFTLISNNDDIVFTNSNTGNLNNDDANVLIDQSQTTINAKIGRANYDIGHTVSTGAGGLASLGVVCTSSKAQGVTGSPAPINDPYDVDYVCHEIGHQFDCEHTFNGNKSGCDGNGNKATAVEPGSGITIMGYAGICGSDNIASNSIPHFHGVSHDQINNFITNGSGKNCGTKTTTTNHKPEVVLNTTKFTIPQSTPFELTGSATDQDNDEIMYSWEQVDAGTSFNAPDKPSGNSPLFMSLATTNSSTRSFPRTSDLLDNTTTYGEILPTYTRIIQFRLTARDQKGGVDFKEVEHNVDGNSGPFSITTHNTSDTKTGNASITVNWDVSNTNKSPVNCNSVDILFSSDGGETFPTTLLASTANDGSATITLPNITTEKARIKVKASNNIFFDVNDANFTIIESNQPEFSLTSAEKSSNLCGNQIKQVLITTESINNFTGAINLSIENIPQGITASYSENTINSGGTSILSLKNNTYTGSDFTITVIGTSGNISKEELITVSIKDFPKEFDFISPTYSDIISSSTTIKWEASFDAKEYSISIATNSAQDEPIFTKTAISSENVEVNDLIGNTQYFVQVSADNECGATLSEMSFTTSNCVVYTQENELIIESKKTVNSPLVITEEGSIERISITSIKGSHDWVGDMTVKLKHPSGVSATLFESICDDDRYKDFNLGFSDLAPAGNIPCPPTNEQMYKPVSPFTTFNAKSLSGTWLLEISDGFDDDDGLLEEWKLEACYSPVENTYERLEANKIGLYPNPAQNILLINGIGVENKTITITNTLGIILMKTLLPSSKEINISRLPQGIYYVKIKNQVIPFVKQ